jgi:hypothetical protein
VIHAHSALQNASNVGKWSGPGGATNASPGPDHGDLYERCDSMADAINIAIPRPRSSVALSSDWRCLRKSIEGDGWKTPNTYCKHFAPLPEGPGVYLLTVVDMEAYEHGFVAYVGMSTNVRKRIDGHNILPLLNVPGYHPMPWFKRVKADDLRAVEARYIRLFNPPWNISGKQRGVALNVRPLV